MEYNIINIIELKVIAKWCHKPTGLNSGPILIIEEGPTSYRTSIEEED